MRLILQRVSRASVSVGGDVIGKIGHGLLVFVGIEEQDEEEDARWLANKLLNCRVFNDQDGRMNRNIDQVQGELLLISQFTLHASVKKGHRPSFIRAAGPDKAKNLYNTFVELLRNNLNDRLKTGLFGAHMHVELLNDGPVTLLYDSKNPE